MLDLFFLFFRLGHTLVNNEDIDYPLPGSHSLQSIRFVSGFPRYADMISRLVPESNNISGPIHTPVQAANGRFDIENCTPTEAQSVKAALQYGRFTAEKALVDIRNGQHSKHGLRALFKNNYNFARVSWHLHDLATLTPMPNVYRNKVEQESSPVFVCVSRGREMNWGDAAVKEPMDQYYELCKIENVPGLYMWKHPYIFLCPLFFHYPIAPEPARSGITCPHVWKNKYVGIVERLVNSQASVLLHELTHFYLRKENVPPGTETYKANELVSLNVPDSWRNPAAYEYYIACRSRAGRFCGNLGGLTILSASQLYSTVALSTQIP